MNSCTPDSRTERLKATIAMITAAMIIPTEPSRYSQKGRLKVTP